MSSDTKDVVEVAFWCVNACILLATAYYIATGPMNAVRTGRQLNNEQQKDNAKRNLFLTLFALRGNPSHYDFVRCLNQIDIVFEDTPTVLNAWHKHFDSLLTKGQVDENQVWALQRVDLLSAMAVELGYQRIRQTDMIRNYYPEGHGYQSQEEFELRQSAKHYFQLGVAAFELMLHNTPRRPDPAPDDSIPQ